MKLIPLLLIGLSGLALAAEPPAVETPPKGLASSDWSSIRAAYEAGRHAIQRQENGSFTARNPGQQWRTEFDGKGFLTTPDHGQWTWGLELTGYGGRTLLSASSSLTHQGNKISNQRDAHLTEWFINDTRGLEQGWTIHSRSVGILPTSSPLTLNLTLRGNLHAQVSPDSSSVAFQTPSGSTALTYGGLKAWDADGKNLQVRFEPAGENAIRIAVEDQNARYPITIDPIAQQAYLKASNAGANDAFGYRVAVSGDTVVVGTHQEDSSTTGVNSTPNELASDSGAAYVFTRSEGTWSQQAYLKASNTGAGDNFGQTVAVSGDTVVVGAHLESSSTTGVNSTPDESARESGAAYIFTRIGATWTQQAYLKASNTESYNRFGESVTVSEDTVVVGGYFRSSGSGVAYIFTRKGTTWSQQAYVQASNAWESDHFGRSMAVSGDTLVVGAYLEDSSSKGINSTPNESASDSGAAYVFARSGTTWIQQAYLKASNTGESDYFGHSVAVSGDTVVVGASGEDSSTSGVNSAPDEGAESAGATYVFTRSGTTWSQQAYLKASNTGGRDFFGFSVAVSGDTVVVGAYGEDSNTTEVNSMPNENADSPGAAYVFTRSGTTWSQQAYLKASNTEWYDAFGFSVAVSGDTVVVGAIGEDSSTSGVNCTPNESAVNSGATYVFSLPAPAITAVSPDPRTTPITTMSITFIDPVQNFNLSDLTLTRDNGRNLIDGTFSLMTADNTLFTLTIPAAVTTPGGTYRLAVLVSDIVDLDGIPLGFGGEEQWLTLSTDQDTDDDGMNDASEFNMAALGFDWQVSQPSLVSTYQNNANGAGYYSLSQVQALNSGTPLIQRNPATGKFKLTMDWKKSTDLTTFTDFPAPAGSAISISPTGDIEFEFSAPDNAAFFRLGLE